MIKDCSTFNGPEGGGFTHRSTIDPDTMEMFSFSGLMKDTASSVETARNCIWALHLESMEWSRIYSNEKTDAEYWKKQKEVEPCPRYAHQFVYDHETKV
jgi:hypothetical protein